MAHRTSISVFRTIIQRAALLGCVTALIAGCDWGQTEFPEYEGLNLIEGRDFGAVDAGGNAVWTVREDAVPFMTWEEADPSESIPGAAATTEALGNAPIYRLEMKNLIANGDFEDSTVGLGAWQTTGVTNAEVITREDFASAPENGDVPLVDLHGDRVLSVDFEGIEERVFLDLRNAAALTVPVAEGLVAGKPLALFIDFRIPVSNFALSLNDATTTSIQNQIRVNRTGDNSEEITYRYPGTDQPNAATGDPARNQFVVEDTGYRYLSFGGFTALTGLRADGVFDNVRLTKADVHHAVRLAVPFRDPLQPGRPAIIGGGTYTVSVRVARDATAGSDNRFDPRYLTIGVIEPVQGGIRWTETVFLEDPEIAPGWNTGEWSTVQLTVQPDLNITGGSTGTAFYLELEIGNAPRSTHQYPGSLMISSPSVVWNP